MIEILLIALVLGLALLLPWIQQWDPSLLLVVITAILNLINLGMTFINILQARRRDPRFLDAGILGAVQILIGVTLLGSFALTLGPRGETWACGLPYLIGGLVVLATRSFSRSRS